MLRYQWAGHFFHLNLAMQKRLLPPASLDMDPIWIFGLWRSGTTALHELLMADRKFCAPRTWQCMAPSSFAITGRPSHSTQLDRPMDDMVIATDSPQEDEFAWLMLGGHSVYRGFLDPRRLTTLEWLLNPDAWDEQATWIAEAMWRDFLGQVVAQDEQRRRLILKSPNHSFRAPALLRRFPNSDIVWITRSPAEIVQSNLKMWPSMINIYGLAGTPNGVLEHFIESALRQAARSLTRLRATLSRRELVVVRQQDLRASPGEVRDSLLRHWHVSATAKHAAELPSRAIKSSSGASLVLNTAWQEAIQLLNSAQEAALDSHGL